MKIFTYYLQKCWRPPI